MQKYALEMPGRVLDFGCGSKPYRSLFSGEYIGVDFAKSGHDHSNEEIDVFYDGKKLPFPNASFDAVLCSEVIEHLFNLEELLQELHRVLKPEGRMLVTCPFVWNEHEAPYDYARYTRFALADIFLKNHFMILAGERIGSNIEALHQIRILYAIGLKYSLQKALPGWLSWMGDVYQTVAVRYLNFRGILLDRLFPRQYGFYITNCFFVAPSTSNSSINLYHTT